MIIFEKVRYKNILSTGNAWTEINLNLNKSTLIVGENGAGKSTILDAISFAIYGKAFRNINKPQLINSINGKGLEVEVFMTIGENKYVIKRGMKPTMFEIWKNDELINQDAASRDYQAYLEENILKMNFKSFGQIVVLGSSTFVPFMQLPAKSRREVIEDLLDIQIFTTMNLILKDRVTSNKNEIADIKYRIELTKNSIDAAKDHNTSIQSLKRGEVSKIKEKMRQHIKFVEDKTADIETISLEVDELLKSIDDKKDVKKEHSTIQDTVRTLLNTKTTLTKESKFYEDHDNCPTCKQGIEHDFKLNTLADHNITLDKIDNECKIHSSRKTILEERLSTIEMIEANINSLHVNASEHRANIKMAKTALISLKNELDGAEKEVVEIDTSKIVKLEEDLKTFHSRQSELFDERETLNIVGALLKDGGIKTRIIKQYVPVMNKLINKYLAAMDFFVDFQLDESFNETIKSRFRDVFSYASFSEGEKLRIDLALLFTWRAISKLRNSTSTNLLIMDEIMDSSLDSSGMDEFMKIINELTADSNIFVISHKGDQLIDKFDHIVKFEKIKNFSRMAS